MMVRRVLGLFGCAALVTCSLEFDEFTFDSALPPTTAASSATVGSGGQGGQLIIGDCNSPVDCPGADVTCQSRTCVSHTCGTQNADAGTPCTDNGGTVCNGLGACVQCIDGGDCPNGVCDNGVCTGCMDNVDCPMGWCDNGMCAPPKADGGPCMDPAECTSMNCVDGFCCDTMCNGVCEACSAALTGGMDGTCTPMPFATDPEMECTMPDYCQGDASCGTCGQPTPPVGGTCPVACNGGCANNICVILCNNANQCQNQAIICPLGFACQVQCGGNQGCRNATVACPPDHACDVQCNNSQACRDINVTCSSQGPCQMSCSTHTNVCQGADLNCGNSSCIATCAGNSTPTVNCGTACWCAAC